MKRHKFWLIVLLLAHTVCIRAQFPASEHLSSHKVSAFAEDSLGYIWIGTNYGLNRYSGSGYSVYHSRNDSLGPNNDNITSMMIDCDNRLWMSNECGICVSENGKFRYPPNTGFNVVMKVLDQDPDYVIITGRQGIGRVNKKTFEEEARFFRPGIALITTFCVAPGGEVWIATAHDDGSLVYVLGADLQLKEMITLPAGTRVSLIESDAHGRVWLATGDGLIAYDSRTKQPVGQPDSLKRLCDGKKIHFVLPYGDADLLIGVRGAGMFCYNPQSQSLAAVNRQELLVGSEYVCYVDSHKNIWLSDRMNAIEFYPRNVVYENLAAISRSLNDSFIKDVCLDRDGHLWVRSSKDILCYDYRKNKVLHHISGDIYGGIFIDRDNTLWVINNFNKLEQYALTDGVPRLKKVTPFQSNIFSMSQDKYGRIWVSLTDLFAVIDSTGQMTYKHAPEGIEFSGLHTAFPSDKMFLYTHSHGVYEFGDDQQFIPLNKSIPNPSYVYMDRKRNYWIGTYNAGLFNYNPASSEYRQFDSSSGLVDNNIKSVLEDPEGNIWFSTSTHIMKYDTGKNSFTSVYDNNFNNGSLYSTNCAAIAPNGTMFFGGSGGVTMIDPGTLEYDTDDVPLYIDVILVNGKVQPEITGELNLDYTENVIAIWYSGVSYQAGASLTYAYKLENFDKDWVEAGTSKRASYSNLPGGNYTFRVKVRKPDGEWSKEEPVLKVKISPAPWASPLAYFIYWVVGLAIAYTLARLIIRWRTQEERLRLAEAQKQMKQEHIDFVTNISHEFRTPLSLIYGPLKELVSLNGFTNQQKVLMNNIQRSVDRLLQLAEQILDFNKSTRREPALKIVHSDLACLVRVVCDNFRFVAREKGVALKPDIPETLPAWFDIEKTEKILCNLISNAIKYTGADGEVRITITPGGDSTTAAIEVADTGIGIAPEKRKDIFKRFARLGADKCNPDISGYGIGLNYSQYLAHLHHGSITYAPKQPQGSRFCLTIPVDRDAYPPEVVTDAPNFLTPYPVAEVATADKDYTLLIIEDNLDVRNYLSNLLSADYNVATAPDAEEGWENLQLAPPDLVLSDVVMPGKDGFELCRMIKSSTDYGHIPVVLLTAKVDMDNNIKGLDCGADAYVNKPFDPFYLRAIISNILTNRKRIQQIILNLTPAALDEKVTPGENLLSEPERLFLERLYAQIDTHLSDEDFNVNALAKEMGMSYSSLYAKIKSLTGQPPQTFFSTYRMNIAMELLRSGNYTVSEVCYKIGASSLASFSKSFKKKFGVSPSSVGMADKDG